LVYEGVNGSTSDHKIRNATCDGADLWWVVYTKETGWSTDLKFNDHKTAENTALPVYADPQATVDTNLGEGRILIKM
jgi:hypothetical protein